MSVDNGYFCFLRQTLAPNKMLAMFLRNKYKCRCGPGLIGSEPGLDKRDLMIDRACLSRYRGLIESTDSVETTHVQSVGSESPDVCGCACGNERCRDKIFVQHCHS